MALFPLFKLSMSVLAANNRCDNAGVISNSHLNSYHGFKAARRATNNV